MECERCHGMMVYEKFFDGPEAFWGQRCVNCGECIDAEILKNRRFSKRNEQEARKKGAEENNQSYNRRLRL